MGQLALAAKITHVPSMYLSELPGPRHGTRQDAIDGHMPRSPAAAKALGVDTLVVFDTHWLVNASYHVNCAPHFKGTYTSNELPHFISNLAFEAPGNPALGQLLARVHRAGRGDAGAPRHQPGARIRHPGAAALHECRPALQGGQRVGAVHGALPE
jgi:3,4-dihydroxyphenylacetate 2,3-dioxygenase